MKKKSFLQLIAILTIVTLCTGLASCSSDDDDSTTEPNNSNEQIDPEPPFTVQLYSFENGIGGNLFQISSNLESKAITGGNSHCYEVTNADSSVYKSIVYEQYPTSGQAAQGIKEITVILADEYPATTEQLVEYLQRFYTISSENDVWKFSDSENSNRQKFVLTFTASARKLVYTYVNEPLFLDFSQYLGTNIKNVGWGSIDSTGNFLTYTPHGLRDGYIWEVNMFADWASNSAGQLQNWKAVKTVTIQFELNLDKAKADSIVNYLERTYIYDSMWDNTNGYGYRYHNEAKTITINYSHKYEKSQKDRNGVIHIGNLHEIQYQPYK